MDHARSASGSPGEILPSGVAITTPQTTITRLRTWTVVMKGLLLTSPAAAWKICKEIENIFIIFEHLMLKNKRQTSIIFQNWVGVL